MASMFASGLRYGSPSCGKGNFRQARRSAAAKRKVSFKHSGL